MFLTTKFVLPGGRTEKHYDDTLSGMETGLYSLVLSASGHDLSLANIFYGPASPWVQTGRVCSPWFAVL
jgi:hypothetical protein